MCSGWKICILGWYPQIPKEKLSYVYYVIKWSEAKLRTSKLTSVFHHLPSVGPKQLCVLAHLEYTREVGSSYLQLNISHYSNEIEITMVFGRFSFGYLSMTDWLRFQLQVKTKTHFAVHASVLGAILTHRIFQVLEISSFESK